MGGVRQRLAGRVGQGLLPAAMKATSGVLSSPAMCAKMWNRP